MKRKHFPRWNFSFLLTILAILAIIPVNVMSESIEDNNQIKITQRVICEISLTLPLSIKKICVLEVLSDQSLKPLELKYLDNRIVTDHDVCDDPRSNDPSNVTIMFIKDVSIGIRQMERPAEQFGEVYDRIIKHLDAGNFVASAGLAKCGADMNVYVFEIGEDGPQLIESAVIGKVECLAK